MREQNREVDCEYFIPNMLYWFTESLLFPFIGGDSVSGEIGDRDYPPSINLILPYQYPKYLHGAPPPAIRQYSRVALKNALTVMTVLEERYLKLQGTSLTLRRLGEALVLRHVVGVHVGALRPHEGDRIRRVAHPGLVAGVA